MRIPKSFNLFASRINVNFDNEKLSDGNMLGNCSFTDLSITLCDEYKGESLSESVVIDTFYHEKVHTILDSMGESKLSANEKFVEVFSRLLRQSDESAKFHDSGEDTKLKQQLSKIFK